MDQNTWLCVSAAVESNCRTCNLHASMHACMNIKHNVVFPSAITLDNNNKRHGKALNSLFCFVTCDNFFFSQLVGMWS